MSACASVSMTLNDLTGSSQSDASTDELTENAGHEIAGHENAGHEFARHDKYRMKIDYITLGCALPLNF